MKTEYEEKDRLELAPLEKFRSARVGILAKVLKNDGWTSDAIQDILRAVNEFDSLKTACGKLALQNMKLLEALNAYVSMHDKKRFQMPEDNENEGKVWPYSRHGARCHRPGRGGTMKQIPKSELLNEHWYRGKGRNADMGLWLERFQVFAVVGKKFNNYVLKFEGYWTRKDGCFKPYIVMAANYDIERKKQNLPV